MKATQTKISTGSLLITLGIVFGDIGTSPLYVFKAITQGKNFDPMLIMGSLSCIFWTLIIIVSLKYVVLALNADNNGEGGIFALYARLRKTGNRWIIFPALVGCATLISDGFLTPAISISSAVEGLNSIFPDVPTLPIAIGIITALFLLQQFGTNAIGKFFGPVMFVWFLSIGSIGLYYILDDPASLQAINPYYALKFLSTHPGAIWILGAVFLCATGAEALYSDLGHCGKLNIRISWAFVLSMLLLNYFGQASFLLNREDSAPLDSVFYSMIGTNLLPIMIVIATSATIIASQALITGIFTLVNEAIKLRLWANFKVIYTSSNKAQVYIPFINYFLLVGCLTVLFIFQKSSAMESAYGLAITIDMLMTTLLLGYFLLNNQNLSRFAIVILILLFSFIEFGFLFSNLNKLGEGGWFTLVLASVIFIFLYLFYHAREIRKKHSDYLNTQQVLPYIQEISQDSTIPHLATNLVYPCRSNNPKFIDSTIVHSLIGALPKKAQNYWFIHLDITNHPWHVSYKVSNLIPHKCFFVNIKLGFKETHDIDTLMTEIIEKLSAEGKVNDMSAYPSLRKFNLSPDFRFVLLSTRVSNDAILSKFDLISIKFYRLIKSLGISPIEDFGLDHFNVNVEYIPIKITNLE